VSFAPSEADGVHAGHQDRRGHGVQRAAGHRRACEIVFDRDVLREEWYGCSDGTTTGYMKVRTEDILQVPAVCPPAARQKSRRCEMGLYQNRIVVKVGTSTLTNELGQSDLRSFDNLACVLSDIQNMGYEVILVSSGAIAVGTNKLG
jgi:hypothetical protein